MMQKINHSQLLVLLIWPLLISPYLKAEESQSGLAETPTNELNTLGSVNKDSSVNGDKLSEIKLNSHAYLQEVLAADLPGNQVVWLETRYSNSENTVKILALENPPKNTNIEGAVLLLHDEGQHAAWPSLLGGLREELPYKGWYTLSINFPRLDSYRIPERELPIKKADTWEVSSPEQLMLNSNLRARNGAEESEKNTASETEALDKKPGSKLKQTLEETPYGTKALAHVQAAMDHIAERGYQNVIIIAYKSGVEIALQYIQPLSADIEDKGFGLIMIDPEISNDYQENMGKALGENFQAPILDIVDKASSAKKMAAKERKASARLSGSLLYQQTFISTISETSRDKSLIKRISDWLAKYAPGMTSET
jgi:hypothetical protein